MGFLWIFIQKNKISTEGWRFPRRWLEAAFAQKVTVYESHFNFVWPIRSLSIDIIRSLSIVNAVVEFTFLQVW